MKKIQLTQNKYTLVDDEDFNYINQFNWFASKGRYTYYSARTRYLTNKSKEYIPMHRILMNCPDSKFVDHINGNGLDNRKSNLRICTRTQNQGNRKIQKNSKTSIRGVSWHKQNQCWYSRITMTNKGIKSSKYLGSYKCLADAKAAYDVEYKKYFGRFANTR